MGAIRTSLGLATLAAALLPLALVFASGAHIFSWAHEFIAYRIGHALALAAGEGEFVRPVQGLPNALLSKWIIAVLDNPVSYAGTEHYAWTFFAAVALAVIAIAAWAWTAPDRSMEQRLAVSAFLIAPWYVGGASMGLMLVPDYWIFEYVWLGGSLIILFRPPRSAFALGLWLGLGASIKISLAGAGVVLLAAGVRDLRGLALTATGALTAYVAILFLYAGGEAPYILLFQIGFYLDPNASAIYGGLFDALAARPAAIVLAALALAAAMLCGDRRVGVAALAAIALTAWLVYKRPHDTSLTSAGLSLAFLAFGLGNLRVSAPALALTAVLLGFPPTREWRATINTPSTDWPLLQTLSERRGVWLLYGNAWNATLLPQALGYNGALALRPAGTEPLAFRRLFPGVDLVDLKEGDAALSRAIAAARAGAHLIWTEPSRQSSDATRAALNLRNAIGAAGLTVTAVEFTTAYRKWTLFTAAE